MKQSVAYYYIFTHDANLKLKGNDYIFYIIKSVLLLKILKVDNCEVSNPISFWKSRYHAKWKKTSQFLKI